jgi:tetratricopeptide (TPR) repeat protein
MRKESVKITASAFRRPLVLLVVAVAAGSSARAQDVVPNPPDSLSAAGKELRLGNTGRAKELYSWVLHRDRKSTPARLGLGRVAIAENDWSEGCDMFQDVIERDTGSIAARYCCGICRREYGAQVAFILRRIQWQKAMDDFLWVLARDSSYEDVLYQLALLYRYKDEYDLALDLGRLQIERKPELSDARLGLFRLYRFVLAVVSPREIFSLLQRRHDPFAVYFAGEALRRQKRYEESEQILKTVLGRSEAIPVQAIYCSLARICFARGDPAGGEAYYWRAVDSISSWLGSAILFEDIKYILTDAELQHYRSLASDRKKSAFFHLFWNLRNPSPAARTNVRLAEHERRILRAEDEFEYYGFRTHFNDPDKLHYLSFPRAYSLNQEYNDKGLVFIRHGDPDDIQRTLGDNESWLYNGTDESPKRIFYFALSNSAGNNWRLTSFPEDPRMWESLVMWDHRYNRLVNGQALDQAQLEDQLRAESGTTVTSGLATDEHTWKKEMRVFTVPHSISTFRGDGGKTLVNVSYALPAGEIAKDLADTVKTLRVEIGLSMNRSNGEVMASRLDTLSLQVGPMTAGSYVELYRFVLRPDSVRIAMHARPLGLEMVSTWGLEMRIPDYPGTAPMLSDIELLLPSNAKSSIEIEGVKVIASPFDAVPRREPLYVYWQAYNLTKDADGKTGYRSRVLLTPGESGPDDASIVAYDRDHSGQEESAAELARIDVRPRDRGIYTLTVEMTDKKMVHTFSKSRLLQLTGD